MTPILMYHEVTNPGALSKDIVASWTVSPAQFRGHLAVLADMGYTGMSVARWLDIRGCLPAGMKPVVMSFDDGYRGNLDFAIPALLDYGWTATFFVISGKMGIAPYASAKDWERAAMEGMDIASHTATHPFAAMLSQAALRAELLDSRKATEDAIGQPVTGLSWPNGDAPRGGRKMLVDCGYTWGATSRAGFAGTASDRLSLPRLAVRSWHDANAINGLIDSGAPHRFRMAAVDRTKRLARAVLGRRRYAKLQMKAMGDA